jgi:hypothetical protein
MNSRARAAVTLTRVQSFEKLRRTLELTGLQEATVAVRQQNVRDAVAAQLTVVDDFLTGSYRRRTLIGPLNRADVDIMVVLDRSYRDRGPRAVLELVKKALLVEYTRAPTISRNGQAVTVTFTDFVVDVVPAFARPWWASWDESWEICDSGSDSWITTNPNKHVRLSTSANRAHGGHLVPRIKQLKAWNRTVDEPLRSFHLEALAWSVFGTSWLWHENMRSDWVSARYFFDTARGKLRYKLSDPSGGGGDIGEYLTGASMEKAISKMTTAFERCIQAEKAAKNGDVVGMHEEYGRVFGDDYLS